MKDKRLIIGKIFDSSPLLVDEPTEYIFCEFKNVSIKIKSNCTISYSYINNSLIEENELLQINSSISSLKDDSKYHFNVDIPKPLLVLFRETIDTTNLTRAQKCQTLIEQIKEFPEFIPLLGITFLRSDKEWEIKTIVIYALGEENDLLHLDFPFKKPFHSFIWTFLFDKEFAVRNAVANLIYEIKPNPVELRLESLDFLSQFETSAVLSGLRLIKPIERYFKSINPKFLLNSLLSDKLDIISETIHLLGILNPDKYYPLVKSYLLTNYKTLKSLNESEYVILEILELFQESSIVTSVQTYILILDNFEHQTVRYEALASAYYDNHENSEEIQRFIASHYNTLAVNSYLEFMEKEN